MKINDYYLQELNALRTLGSEFSKKNPGLSPYLAREGQDPDVERILEGFSFLTGRLRQQLDEELPEVSHNLAQLLWPNYVRPIPSYSVIAYEPIRESTTSQSVPRGTEVLSQAVEEGVQCRFHTCYETQVHPLELSKCSYFVQGEKSQLELDFSMSSRGHLDAFSLKKLRVYLSGSRFIARELYLFLLQYVESIEVDVLDYEEKVLHTLRLRDKAISPVGFGTQERMLPYPRNIFDGYIMLQEYFSFEEKYLFVDIEHIESVFKLDPQLLAQSRQFKMRFNFAKRIPSAHTPTKDNFVLYCTPIINLFEEDAIPIRKNQMEEEYLLSPSDFEHEESEVFAVQSVRGWIPSKNSYQDFLPFESFGFTDNNEYYSARVKLSDDGKRTHSYIRFASPEGMFEQTEHTNATISARLLCTNQSLPSRLQLGQISIPDPLSSISHLKFQNITIPTESYPPPIGGDFLWRLISNMSLNYLSLTSVKTLVAILSSYDFLSAHDIKQKKKRMLMLQGLESISHTKTEMIYQGYPIRGIQTHLQLDVSKFTGMGEAYLLCCVLNEFFALYCNINSFHRLEVHMLHHDTFTWPPKMGCQPLV